MSVMKPVFSASNGSRCIVGWVAAILLPAALFFSVIADLPYVLALTVSCLLFAGWRRRPLAITDRSVIYLLLAALVMTALGNYASPARGDRFGFMAVFSRPGILVPLALYGAALLASFRNRAHSIGAAGAAALIAFGFGGDFRTQQLVCERMSAFNPLLVEPYWFYCTLMGSSILALLLSARHWRWGEWRRPWPVLILWLLLVVAAIFLSVELHFYRKYESRLRNMENLLLRIGSQQLTIRPGFTVDSGVNLLLPFPPDRRDVAEQVILRAVGKSAPGYLRGSVLSNYERGGWSSGDNGEHKSLEASLDVRPGQADQLYGIRSPRRTDVSWSFYPDQKLEGRTLLLPGNAESVELIADNVEGSPNGRVEVEGLLCDAGYNVYVETPEQAAPFDGPAAPGPELLQLPAPLRKSLQLVNHTQGVHAAKSDRERMALLTDWLLTDFSYDLKWPGSQGKMDPVEFFLTQRKSGHCELFASALALLLREAGVPARYITGVVCFEPHPSGRYYVARVRNAHAWVEAYDRQEKRWVLLDATPASVNRPEAPPASWSQRGRDLLDYGKLLFDQLIAGLRRGRIIGSAVILLWDGAAWMFHLVWHPLRGPLFALLLWWYLLRRLRRLRQQKGVTAERLKAQAEFRAFCRHLCRSKLLPPGEEPTAVELIARIQADETLPPGKKRDYLWFLNDYLIRRFR